MFREELDDLKNRTSPASRCTTCSRAKTRTRRCSTAGSTTNAPADIPHTLVPAAGVDEAFVCGPAGMIDAAVAALAAVGHCRQRRSTSNASATRRRPAHHRRRARRRPRPGHAGHRRPGPPGRVSPQRPVHPRRRAPHRAGRALRLQGRRVLHLQGQAARGRGAHGPQLRAHRRRGGAGFRAVLPVAPAHAEGRPSRWTSADGARALGPTSTLNRETIVRAAARLFAHQGYPGTSMNDLARACGISKPLLYHYVNDKYQLLLEITEGHVSRLEALVAEVNALVAGPAAALARADPALCARVRAGRATTTAC